MVLRIKLCAIAKDEGAYLLEWVGHHLYFGFDGIEVFINGTTDRSVPLMRRIRRAYPSVNFKVVDDLLADSLAQRRNFQYRAYWRMARRANAQGYTHVAFMDLDEYWVPRDFTSSIAAFVPSAEDVNVVSFPWFVDLPQAGRSPWQPPVRESTPLQADPHVKSIIRMDDRIRQIRSHTARTKAGRRLLVDETFPLEDDVSQQWGSIIAAEYFQSHRDRLPEAFILHAMHRSEAEYLASLAQGLRQNGHETVFKVNRRGYTPSAGPVVTFDVPPDALARYGTHQLQFNEAVNPGKLIAESQQSALQRRELLIERALNEPMIMETLAGPLQGISEPRLDKAYPGWNTRLEWHIDDVRNVGDLWRARGWAFVGRSEARQLEFSVIDSAGDEQPFTCLREDRPDVRAVHSQAPLGCGFRVSVPGGGLKPSRPLRLRARVQGSAHWHFLYGSI
ncbi:glycosyltransferase family 2 protein [Nocardioides bigeumensis]|uniref:Glycosyl transferase family 2 n=1 Tax=Nocardioides bigeumensis TaxID=433657 RepID=A0ABP5JZM8_9ACTN